MEKDLSQLVEKLKAAAGANLKSVVLYGSAARGDYHAKHSDLNVLCVVGSADAHALSELRVPAAWWEQKGHPAPLVFTAEELRNCADVFAIEFMDIRASRRVLYGGDVFAGIEVPTRLHAQQVERELRTNLIRLRQAYLRIPRSDSALLDLMDGSLGSFKTLFRHALIALGDEAPKSDHEAVDLLGTKLGFDPAAFHALQELREGKRAKGEFDAQENFARYLGAIAQVNEALDRRLAAKS
jgi:predicted nucleotidyltransferase